MANYRTYGVMATLLLAVIVSAQHLPTGPPTGIQTYFTGATANTPAVVLGSWAYVGTNRGVVGGSVFSEVSSDFINSPPINIVTSSPVTALWNTSATEMVAVANNTLFALSGNLTKWTFTSPDFQFDFAASMPGQYPTPLVWNNTIFIGTGNLNWSWTGNTPGGWSWIYAIDLSTGNTTWRVNVSAPFTNYPIQLGDDLQTLVVRATNPHYQTVIHLLRGIDGVMFPLVAPTNRAFADDWLPQSTLLNGILWINDVCYVIRVNVSTAVSQQKQVDWLCSASGFAPVWIGNANKSIYFVTGSFVAACDPATLAQCSSSRSSIGDIQQVVPYDATSYIVCGPSGLQVYDTMQSRPWGRFFLPSGYYGNCQSLGWVNGQLIASFGATVFAFNLTARTIVWENAGNEVNGVGPVTAIPTPTFSSTTFVMANRGFMRPSGVTSLLVWSAPIAAGWLTDNSISLPSSITYFGAPYDVVVVPSVAAGTVTVQDASNGAILSTLNVAMNASDPLPFLVGDFACCNGYSYLWCVALTSDKRSFKVSTQSPTYLATVSGSFVYLTSQDEASVAMLNTNALPALTALPLPPSQGQSPGAFIAAVIVGQNAAGQAMLFGATEGFTLYGISISPGATSWAVYTLDPTNASLYGATFTTNVVQVPGDDGHILVGGLRTSGESTEYGLFKFSTASQDLVAMYEYPSVTAYPVSLVVASDVILIVGGSNITATNQHGEEYWHVALEVSYDIEAVALALSSGVAVATVQVGGGYTNIYTINVYTGETLWKSSLWWPEPNAAMANVVDGLVVWTDTSLKVANLVTGQLVVAFPGTQGVLGNGSSGAWVYTLTSSGSVYGAPINSNLLPPASERSVNGSFPSLLPPGTEPPPVHDAPSDSKVRIIAVDPDKS